MGKIIEATKTGDRLQTLIALRDLLAERLEETKSGRDTAALVKRLMEVSIQIDILTEQQNSPHYLDEMRARIKIIR